MPAITVTDQSKAPKMTSTGYVGQTAEELSAGLKRTREMLTPEPIEKERLKRVGHDGYGDVYIDLFATVR